MLDQQDSRRPCAATRQRNEVHSRYIDIIDFGANTDTEQRMDARPVTTSHYSRGQSRRRRHCVMKPSCQYSCDRPQRPTDSHCTTSTRVQRVQRLHVALTSLHTQLVSCAVE
jgi:hypothetical protein